MYLIDGIFYVSEEEANQLHNSTVRIAAESEGGPERYPMSLDVFHQLHCLVRVPVCVDISHTLTRLFD